MGSGHHCHATGCRVAVPPEMFMCRRHWFALPAAMRNDIYRTYRPGQCDDWHISHAYANAARAAVRFIAAKEGIEPDTSVYDMLDPIEKTPGVCGGAACTRGTRITVWGLIELKQIGYSDEQILDSIQGLTKEELEAALAYYIQNKDEIEQAIVLNREAR